MRRLVPLLLLLGLAGCHEPAAPRSDKATPLTDLGPKPAHTVSQAAVDRAVPAGVAAYVGWRITWDGGMPEDVILERFVRGKCFARGRFRAGAQGDFDLEAIPAEAAKTGGAVKPGMVLLADVLHGSGATAGVTMDRDPIGRVSWVYRRTAKATAAGAARAVVTTFRYEASGCVLPRVIPRGALPPKVSPASTGTGKATGTHHGG